MKPDSKTHAFVFGRVPAPSRLSVRCICGRQRGWRGVTLEHLSAYSCLTAFAIIVWIRGRRSSEPGSWQIDATQHARTDARRVCIWHLGEVWVQRRAINGHRTRGGGGAKRDLCMRTSGRHRVGMCYITLHERHGGYRNVEMAGRNES